MLNFLEVWLKEIQDAVERCHNFAIQNELEVPNEKQRRDIRMSDNDPTLTRVFALLFALFLVRVVFAFAFALCLRCCLLMPRCVCVVC